MAERTDTTPAAPATSPVDWIGALGTLLLPVFVLDESGTILALSSNPDDSRGVDTSGLVGQHIDALLPPEYVDMAGRVLPREEYPVRVALRTGADQRDAVLGVVMPDGLASWFVTDVVWRDEPVGRRLYVWTRDVSDLARDAVHWNQAFAGSAVDELLVDRDHVVTSTNASPDRPSPVVVGQLMPDSLHPDDRGAARVLLDSVLAGGPPGVVRCRVVDGDRLTWVRLHVSPMPTAAGGRESLFVQLIDIDAEVRTESRLREQLLVDGLTGALSSVGALEVLDGWLADPGSGAVVVACDVLRLSDVNLSLGVGGGDELLRQAVGRLERLRHPPGVLDLRVAHRSGTLLVLVRVGGGEWNVSVSLPELVREQFVRPFALGAAQAFIDVAVATASTSDPLDAPTEAGSGLPADPGSRSRTLLARADVALGVAKTRTSRTARFDADVAPRWVDLVGLRAAVRRGLDSSGVQVLYQPVVDLESGSPVGYEALIRLLDPVRGLVLPDALLPVIEHTSDGLEVGREVLRRAAAAAASWGPEGPWVAVNVSARQLARSETGGSFADDVLTILDEAGLDPARLRLELTEHGLHDAGQDLDQLARLRAAGVRVALDDFGTGYASLAALDRFPVDELKIDKRFTSGLGRSGDVAAAVVAAVVTMGTELGLDVVAEGVETSLQRAVLAELGCRLAQGFLFGPPGPEPFRR